MLAELPLIVSGLPLTIQEPFGQSDLRRLIDAAMSADAGRSAPAVHADPQKRVFQYLGNLASPAQIGFVTVHGRIVYDLRSRRARIGDGAWMREADLAADDRALVLDLIQTWERMMLAREVAAGRMVTGRNGGTSDRLRALGSGPE